jgi:hypothetical protein
MSAHGNFFYYTNTSITMAHPDMKIFVFGFMHLKWFITKIMYIFRSCSDLKSVCLPRCDTAFNVKVKVTLEQATKAQRGSRFIALLFL